MKKRGQTVTLKNNETGRVVEAKVILSDSRQGYLAEEIGQPYRNFFDYAWAWFNLNEWEEVLT